MNWRLKQKVTLVDAVLSLRSKKEAQNFLRDLMTESEIEEFARRLQAAEMLSEKIPYTKIVKDTGLSSTTVARVGKWLKDGNDGYKTVIARLHRRNPVQARSGLS